MDLEFLMWLIGYSCLMFGNITLFQAMKSQRRRYELMLAVSEEGNRIAYATGWLHAYQDLGISGSHRLSE